MLPTSGVPNAPSSKTGKTLRASFCGAANHLTQLYMTSLKMEKLAFKKGHLKAIDDMFRFLQENTDRAVSKEALVEYLKNKKREIRQSEDSSDLEDEFEDDAENGPKPINQVGLNSRSIASPFENLNQAPHFMAPQRVNAHSPFTFSAAHDSTRSNTMQTLPHFSMPANGAATFGNAAASSLPFPPATAGPFDDSSRNPKKRDFFEFFFQSAPTTSDANPFQFSSVPSSEPIPPNPNPFQHNDNDGGMDFSSYEQQTWKRTRRDENVLLPSGALLSQSSTSTNSTTS